MAISKKAGLGKKAGATPAAGGSSSRAPGGVKRADYYNEATTRKKQAGVSDMTLLSTISNDAVNDNLKKRFQNAEIYTYIGHVLVSVNPFRMLPIYDDATLRSYRGKNRLEMPPHVYAVAEHMFYNLSSYHESQCVIISGESGAGKTEAAKKIMEYIAAVSGAADSGSRGIASTKDMVLATNPLLESFGNAKTLRNNNSSRFGKYLEIEFNRSGAPVGALITNYLLEKNRVVGQLKDERNFHIFYQLTKGASRAHQEAYGISGPETYAYTSKSGCLDVPGIDDRKDWAETCQAMQTIGLRDDEIDSILRTLAAVLWLGNAKFRLAEDGQSAAVADTSVTDFVAYLMEVPGQGAAVCKALTQRIMETQRGGRRGSVYEVPLNPAQAGAARDALAKALYNNLFEWIVQRINVSMKSRETPEHTIGILDIYGFEIFDSNSFEQLCINYVNEKLQQVFIELTLKSEQEEYAREQIKWTPIDFFNNKVVCDLIEEKRPPGVFAALNDACATAHADPTAADSSFVQRLNFLSSNAHFDGRGDKFLVKHYAGDVMYNTNGMTDKNKDVLGKDLLDLIISSSSQFLQTIFPDRPDPDSKKRPPTASDRIKLSANALVEKLMRSQPSYIRTIKPNQNKSPSEYDDRAILHQIKYLGLQENIRVRRAGFAYRNTFEKMVERFYLLSPATSYAGDYIWTGDHRSGCERILADTGVAKSEWQMGVTKAFIKNPETLFALETMRDKYWHNMARRIQRAFRNFMRYKMECATRIQRFWTSKKEGLAYAQVREYGHQLLGQRKERRRMSLVSMRQFRGDYLDVGGKSALGEMLRGVCGIAPNDVVFSMLIQLLVSKLGRSSKPSPRHLIMSSREIFILITQVVQGRPQTSIERRIPLGTIRSVGLSTLRDDWLAINVQASPEPDPLFSCVFKTELVTHLMQRTNGALQINVAPTITYAKKKDKPATIKFVKDETVARDDLYKSATVHVPTGESPASQSWPTARRKPKAAKAISGGKLLKAGDPRGQKPKSAPASRPTPQAQPLPGATRPSAPAAVAATPTPRAVPSKPVASGSAAAPAPRAAPAPPRAAPRPPPAPPAPAIPMCKACVVTMSIELTPRRLYDFATDQPGEMSLTEGQLVELVKKDDSGWTLVRVNGKEGFAPTSYLKDVEPKAAPARPAAPPKPKPALAPKPGSGSATPVNGSARPTANGSAAPKPAGGANGQMDLAAALAARLQGR